MALKQLFLCSAAIITLGTMNTNLMAQADSSKPLANITDHQQRVSLSKYSNNLQTIINEAEQHYNAATSHLADGKSELAKGEFDQAIDTILNANEEVRRDSQFRPYYLELVERIYKQQLVASQQEQKGFQHQGYDTSPLDELAHIDLDAEGVSTMGDFDVKGFDFQFSSHPSVNQFINFFTQGKGRATMERGLRRSGRYRPMVEKIFKEEGVPLDLMWLAQVESVWVPAALSSAAAKGIWQFIPSTGERFGLNQDNIVDERISPEKSTRAAARYLKFLNNFFAGDWLLAMGAYNCGENGVERAVGRCGYADFWELYNRNLLPQETRNYVPAILAVTIIAKNPEKYGFQVQPDTPWEYDTFSLEKPLDLHVAANLINTPYDALKELNPELKRGVTPANHSLRIPKNTLEDFSLAYGVLSEDQYVPKSRWADESGDQPYRYVRVAARGRGRYHVKYVTIKHVYGHSNRGYRSLVRHQRVSRQHVTARHSGGRHHRR